MAMGGKDLSGSTAKSRSARRRTPRLAVELKGTLGGRTRRPVEVIDLSVTGCLTRGDALYDRDAILDLSLELDPEPLVGKVRVRASSLDGGSPPGAPRYLSGLEFLSLPSREETRLRRFLDEERRRRRGADTPAL